MTTQRIEAAEKRPLDILGIGEAEERAYSWLLAHSGATVPEIAQALAMTSSKTQHLLDAIEAKGLGTHTPERPRRYIPVPPDIAVQALIVQRQNDLQRAKSAVRVLQEQAAATQPRDEREHMVELITSREAERQILRQIEQTAQHEVVCLIRPPVLISKLDVPAGQDHSDQREGQARGVCHRSIVNAEFLALPNAVQRIREDMEAGEEIRVTSHLPFKMILADHRVALIPLNLQQLDTPVLLVRSSALLDALYALFGILWERASPISFTRTGALETGDTGAQTSEVLEDMMSLMAAGLNDKSVAYELDLSMRTFRRRTVELMKSLNARTRFQAGWVAALQRTNQHS